MGGAGSVRGSITAAAQAYQSTLADDAIGYANGNPILAQDIGNWPEAAQSTMVFLADLAPIEPNLGTKIDIRV
jgi:hypothetical protein